jgi:hypothetical protein
VRAQWAAHLLVQPIESARTSCPLVHLGVATVCGIPPGTISVLVPLPLFMSKPCPPLPGSVVVSIEPRWPVTNAGPLIVKADWPAVGPCEPRNATWVAGAESGSAPLAHAWLHSPTNSVTVATAVEIRTKRGSCLRVLIMSVSLLYSSRACRTTGIRSALDLIGSPGLHIASDLRFSTGARVYKDMRERNGSDARP